MGISKSLAVSALALTLAFGGCGGNNKKDSNAKKTPAAKASNSRPAASNPAKATPPEPPKPEIRIAESTGTVEVLKGTDPANQTWAPLNAADTFSVTDAAAFRVAAGGKLTILLPDESKVTADPQTMFFFSENERREIALVEGVLDVQMKDKSTDRAGMQVRTLSGLVRGPQAGFTVGVNPLGDAMVYVERGVVYVGDEKVDLTTQAQQAQQAIDAAATGKEAPKPEKVNSAYTKVDPGKLATFTAANPTPQITPDAAKPATPTTNADPKAPTAPTPAPAPAPAANGETPSAEAVRAFVAATTWEAQLPKLLPEWIKAIEANLTQVDSNLEKTTASKEQNLKQIEELKAARAAKDQAKVTQIQSEITRSSRLLLAMKRQAHLLALEAYMRLNAIEFTKSAIKPGGDAEKVFTTNAAKITELATKVNTTRQKTANLRPRTRVPAPGVNPGVRPLPPGLKIPGAIPAPDERIPPAANGVPSEPQPEISTPQ